MISYPRPNDLIPGADELIPDEDELISRTNDPISRVDGRFFQDLTQGFFADRPGRYGTLNEWIAGRCGGCERAVARCSADSPFLRPFIYDLFSWGPVGLPHIKFDNRSIRSLGDGWDARYSPRISGAVPVRSIRSRKVNAPLGSKPAARARPKPS